ncbi:MAG: exopolysaccharide Pel transporter PelG [Pseudomonadota bacterium]|nr:exopolysaccharide Pel transporter PelG [Pseudomonadota bacterium]
MAGIGFELHRMLGKDTLSGRLQAYTFAAIIGSGPWVLSIVAILAIGLINTRQSDPSDAVGQFQVSITYLMAFSLILTSPLQLMFTRFVADRLFEKRQGVILANLFGALIVTFFVSGVLGALALALLFDGSLFYRQCMLTGFVTLCGIWIVVIFASAIRAYRQILLVFLMGYSITVGAALGLRDFGLTGLLLGFVIGQACLLFALLALVVRQYPGKLLVSFAFLQRSQIYPGLILTGLFYNVGAWADKFIFWADPLTGVDVVGPLRASPIYDLPIFLSYLSLIPGMAIFLIRIETDFAGKCENFHQTITRGGTLEHIRQARKDLVEAVRGGMLAIVKVQGATTVILLLMGQELLAWVGISPMYRTLLNIDLLAVAVQLLLLAILNVLFYLDQRQAALRLCLLFLVSNTVFSWATLNLGPSFFGYGFALAVLLTGSVGLLLLSRKLDQLEYETFMLQPVLS